MLSAVFIYPTNKKQKKKLPIDMLFNKLNTTTIVELWNLNQRKLHVTIKVVSIIFQISKFS